MEKTIYSLEKVLVGLILTASIVGSACIVGVVCVFLMHYAYGTQWRGVIFLFGCLSYVVTTFLLNGLFLVAGGRDPYKIDRKLAFVRKLLSEIRIGSNRNFRIGPFAVKNIEDAMRVLYIGGPGTGKSSLMNVQRVSMIEKGVVSCVLDICNSGKTYKFWKHFAPPGMKVYRVGLRHNDCVGINYANLCKTAAARRQFASSIVENMKGDNQFFTKSGINVIENALSLCHRIKPGEWFLADALRIVMLPDLHEHLAKVYKTEMPYRNFGERSSSKNDTIATVDAQIRSHLIYAMADMRAKVRIDFPYTEGILVLEWTSEHDAALKPTFTFLVNNVSTTYLSRQDLPPMGVFVDEYRYMGNLKDFAKMLAQGRKSGIYAIGSVHNISGLKHNFGDQHALEILALFDTKVFLRSVCPETNDYASRCVGDIEFFRELKNRDGNWSANIERRSHMLPSEFMDLPRASYENDAIHGVASFPGHSQRFISGFRHAIEPNTEDTTPPMPSDWLEPTPISANDLRRLGVTITPEILDILAGKKKEKVKKDKEKEPDKRTEDVAPPIPAPIQEDSDGKRSRRKKNKDATEQKRERNDKDDEGDSPSTSPCLPFF